MAKVGSFNQYFPVDFFDESNQSITIADKKKEIEEISMTDDIAISYQINKKCKRNLIADKLISANDIMYNFLKIKRKAQSKHTKLW